MEGARVVCWLDELPMAAPLDVSPVEARAAPEAALAGAGPVEGRSLGQIARGRLRRDKVAMTGGVIVVFLILVAIIGPHLTQSPNAFHQELIDPTFSRPTGPFGGISAAHPLGQRRGPGDAELRPFGPCGVPHSRRLLVSGH